MKILKLYAFILLSLFGLDAALPHNEAFAWFPHGMPTQTNANSCGVTNNNWCVGVDGWTVFTANNATGTCPGTDTTTGPCFVAVDNSTASSYTGHISVSPTLVIDSAVGTSPSVGQTVVRADGTRLGTITSGSYPNFTLAGSGSTTFATESMTSSLGNDTTCALGAPPTAVYSSLSLSSYVPSKPCYSQSTAVGKLRLVNPKTFTATVTATISANVMQVTAQSVAPVYVGAVLSGGSVSSNTVVTSQTSGTPGGIGFYTVNNSQSATTTTATLSRVTATRDWFMVKKGTTWNGPIAGGNFPANGWSPVDLAVVITYGTGARPRFSSIDGTANECFNAQGLRGYQMAIVGYWCSNQLQDPASASYATYTIGADAGGTICAGATTICNATVPAAVQANPTRYRAFGTGINTNAVTAATATTVTLTSSVLNPTTVGTGQMNIQLTNTTATGGGMTWAEYDTLIIEDNRLDYGAFGPQQSSSPATDIPFARIRRNVALNQYTANNFGGDNMFTSYTTIGAGSIVAEENLFVAGGWVPATWGAYGSSFSHNLYLHNPSVPLNLYSNIIAFNPADNQFRDSGTSYNNTFLYQASGGSLTGAVQDNAASLSYDVHQNTYNIPVATRTMAATPCGGTGVGCNTMLLDGAMNGNPTVLGNSNSIANLTNPGSLVGCKVDSSGQTATSVNLTTDVSTHAACNIAAGNRGNGVQVGDIIRVYQNGGVGVQFNALGQFISNPPGRATTPFLPYPAMSNVSVSAASPAVVTDTAFRSSGEPFYFSPVIISAFGSGYGANVTGTMTWAGSGCTVNPVLNVSTNAAGQIAQFNSITVAGTCSTPPAYNGNAWVAGGGLSAGSNATFSYHMSDGTLPTGVSYANNTGGCTGTVVTNPTTGVGVCTYYALANGTSYQFSATSGGSAINSSGSGGTLIQRTGATLFNFTTPVHPIYVPGVPAGVSAGTDAYIDSAAVGFAGANGKTKIQSLSGNRFTLITEDPLLTPVNGDDQFTMIFGLPAPCSIYPSCYTATVGPNNLFLHSEVLNGSYGAAIQFNRVTSGFVATGNYISNWNSTVASNTVDSGLPGTNTLNSGGQCVTSACVLNQWNDSVQAFPKASVEYYDASQLEAGNTFSGYISNGSGSAGYILTIISGSPSLAVPTNVNYGVGDTVFDTTASANVVSQYTRITAQIDATHYLVSVSQTAGSSGSPIQMMYGSTNRFLAKAATQSRETGWIYAYTSEAANDFIRNAISCGSQVTFPGSPACPVQGATVH